MPAVGGTHINLDVGLPVNKGTNRIFTSRPSVSICSTPKFIYTSYDGIPRLLITENDQ